LTPYERRAGARKRLKGKARLALVPVVGALAAVAISACGGSSSASTSNNSSGSSVNWATVKSVQAGGGMAALVKAAEKEGHLNVITLPDNWANYGTQMKEFKAKYHISITDEIPSGSSAQEIQAIQSDRGDSKAPDVVDVGLSYAVPNDDLWAPYKVSSWNDIPAENKDSNGLWFSDYGGYMSFGCDLKVVKSCPTTWAQLKSPAFKHDVALNGVPGQASAATSAVQAAALNNGGSFTNVQPGLNFFKNLKSNGNFNATDCDAGNLIEAGQCPVIVNWDFLNVAGAWGLPSTAKWKVVVPKGTPFAEYYVQAISKTAPDPAAARLWEEFLYSVQGQNNFLKGHARPVEMTAMEKAGTLDKVAAAALPPIHQTATFPTVAADTKAGDDIAKGWPTL
jgi:putative spermidine/putrescine transport system substrate-binding protein